MSAKPIYSPIPGLPEPEADMNWRYLNRFKKSERRAEFYLACLRYCQHLWLQGFPARAILCLDRAWGADLLGTESVLARWPMPYAPLLHILRQAPAERFLGNPRVHFQHYADRLGEPRREQRKWRSWACWAISCAARPDLPGDPKHDVLEPSWDAIGKNLDTHGHPGETALWKRVLEDAKRSLPQSSKTP